MKRSELRELHYITSIANIGSILRYGILSYEQAKALQHESVAMKVIQAKRAEKKVPGGLALHQYANLYFCARNPMMYTLSAQHLALCILRVSLDVLDLPGIVITDGNAASDYTAFLASPSGLEKVSHELVFAERWTDQDQIEEWRRKRVKCAEVLVPERVEPRLIQGAYVSCRQVIRNMKEQGFRQPIDIDSPLFFQG